MTRFVTRISRLLRSPRAALFIFAALIVGTAGAVLAPHLARGGGGQAPVAIPAATPISFVTQDPYGMQFTGTLSQTKLVQGGTGVVYLDLIIDAPGAALPAAA